MWYMINDLWYINWIWDWMWCILYCIYTHIIYNQQQWPANNSKVGKHSSKNCFLWGHLDGIVPKELLQSMVGKLWRFQEEIDIVLPCFTSISHSTRLYPLVGTKPNFIWFCVLKSTYWIWLVCSRAIGIIPILCHPPNLGNMVLFTLRQLFWDLFWDLLFVWKCGKHFY